MDALKRIALLLTIIGGINWGLIGFFQFDLVASIFGGQDSMLARIVYALVGLSSLYCLTLLFEPDHEEYREKNRDGMESGRLKYGTEFGEETDLSDTEKRDK